MEDNQSSSRFNLVIGDNGLHISTFIQSKVGYSRLYDRSFIDTDINPSSLASSCLRDRGFKLYTLNTEEAVDKLKSTLCDIYSNPKLVIGIEGAGEGIHYRRLDDYWSLILDAAILSDCILYASTQSRDSVSSFVRVFNLDKYSHLKPHVCSLTLYRTTTGEIKTRIRDYDALYEAVDGEYNVMGGE